MNSSQTSHVEITFSSARDDKRLATKSHRITRNKLSVQTIFFRGNWRVINASYTWE